MLANLKLKLFKMYEDKRNETNIRKKLPKNYEEE